MTVTAPGRPAGPDLVTEAAAAGPDRLAAVQRTARDCGLAAGLALVLDEAAVAAAPGPVLALPAGDVDRLVDRLSGAVVLPHRMAASEGIVLLRRRRLPGTRTAAPLPTGLLAAVRLGVSRRLLTEALDHVTHREVGGEPIVRKQLVAGTLADLFTEIEALDQLLRVADIAGTGAVDAHDRIDTLDWEAAKLLGARGFVAGTSTWTGYVSRLVANCWIPREVGPCPLPV